MLPWIAVTATPVKPPPPPLSLVLDDAGISYRAATLSRAYASASLNR